MLEPTVPGVLMRLIQPKSGTGPILNCSISLPGCSKTYTAVDDDGADPTQLSLHILDDISTILSSLKLYEEDKSANPAFEISWVVCSFVNGREKGTEMNDSPSTVQHLSHTPMKGSKLVIVGSTPRPDKESDYHSWYDIEHGPGLATVPGWNAGRRYKLAKSYGDIETASFYGFNYYDEESGLGGPIWYTATKTEWTFRIRGNAAKPNIRRVWQIRE